MDGILFFRDSVSNVLSFFNPLYSLFSYFPAMPEKSNLMLTFSRENLARTQCSVFHMQHQRFLTSLLQKLLPFFTSEEKDQNSSPLSGVRSLAVVKWSLHLDYSLPSAKPADCSTPSPLWSSPLAYSWSLLPSAYL